MALTNPPIATAAATATAAAAAAARHLILHPVPKPITFLEFFDALRAATPPRFPHARTAQPRRIGLAVSGGVDSMALAYLFNQLREINPLMRVVDNPLAKISAYVIDHGLREGSREEALAVVKELRNFKHIRPQWDTVNWKAEGVTGDPNLLPNVESLARRVRYRRLGTLCLAMHVESIFLAHHQDDQYETVLMRLLAGHGSRGLRGMLKAGNIPECYDMHGVYESGHVDDQMMRMPQISFRPPKRDWRHMRRQLVSELDLELYGAELRAGLQTGWHEGPYVGGEDDSSGSDWLFSAASSASAKARAAAAARNMTRIRTEDAGVMIYRPLLEFSKDRLIATCEANNVRWFEDATNKDVTLTTRNAVRHMVRNHRLPVALRKENVLRMSARCGAKLRGLEQEAERWIKRQAVAEFEPNVGTLVVRLPELGVLGPGPGLGRERGRKSANDGVRRELRLAHRRAVAGYVVKRLVAFVSPDRNPPQHTSLQNIVAKLFPTLVEGSLSISAPPSVPRAFNQASILFLPLAPSKWYLVREPYPSLHPLPQTTFTTTSNISDKHRHPTFPPTQWESPEDAEYMSRERLAALDRLPLPQPRFRETRRWYAWRRFKLWDGRFWIRVRGRVKAYFRIAPFAPIHGKAFREGLGGGGGGGEAAAAAAAADGVEEGQKQDSKDKEEEVVHAAPGLGITGGRGSSSSGTTMSAAERRAEFEGILKRFAPGKVRYTLPALYAVNRDEKTGEEVLRMLALPTLGVGLPGLERWVQYEVRYRKVDMGLFERETMGGGGRIRQGRSGGGSGSESGGRSQSGSGASIGGAVLRRHVLADSTAEERVWKRISGMRRKKRMTTAAMRKKQAEDKETRASVGLRSA
ncbi:PP-loop family protein [Colletotrichum abscissum]|uniref:tRNA(Ile)-lysidine synthetase n=1 Tax=Colletotrichum abscissum TaxID=1671311 RepID=A0A9Q0B956_9PEZI|nr:PP-loop family protein [Colletotrichum abscissum]KAI3558319.1 PP-loop family protein [Colletotrichum abscissum]KAK1500453.1 PP-loop family protein [Colletotrichum abscissum]